MPSCIGTPRDGYIRMSYVETLRNNTREPYAQRSSKGVILCCENEPQSLEITQLYSL